MDLFTLRDKHLLILGLGESGLAMVRWCARQGARLTVVDSRENPPGLDKVAAYTAAPASAAKICKWPGVLDDLALLDGVDLLCQSPGVPVQSGLVVEAQRRGIPVVSEIELFAAAVRAMSPQARVLAITGSNGKTTTTALAAHLLNAAGVPAFAAGNISPAALDAWIDALDGNCLPAVWVLELSSFQLESTHTLNAAAAAVLNVSEDHLDRHAGMAGYAEAKARVLRGAGVAVLNREDPLVRQMAQSGQRTVWFGLDAPQGEADYGFVDGGLRHGSVSLVRADALKLAGTHNVANALAALALCAAVGVDAARVLAGLKAFSGLPHRVEWVAAESVAGGVVDYFDDSKGTNVGATLAALQGMGRKVVIILGGDGKGQDFTPLSPALAQFGRAVALIGRDGASIGRQVADSGVPQQYFATLEAAVDWSRAQAQAGDAVLLSPACASLDMFRNYAHRAQVFIDRVNALLKGGA